MKTQQPSESRYVRAARIVYEVTQQVLPKYAHPKSPHHFTLPQVAACVLMTFYLDVSYRDMEEWLKASDKVCEVLELPRIPDHSTLSRTYKKLRMLDFGRMNHDLLSRLAVEEDTIAADSTGYAFSQASAYYQTRSGRTFREWVKGGYAVGCQSLLILAWRYGIAPSNDVPLLNGLRRDAGRYGHKQHGRRAWLFLADAGFDGQAVTDADIIPPIRRGGKLLDPTRRARADFVAQARLDGLYGQRWKCETVNSVNEAHPQQAAGYRSLNTQFRSKLRGIRPTLD
jgi:hypothetical protein